MGPLDRSQDDRHTTGAGGPLAARGPGGAIRRGLVRHVNPGWSRRPGRSPTVQLRRGRSTKGRDLVTGFQRPPQSSHDCSTCAPVIFTSAMLLDPSLRRAAAVEGASRPQHHPAGDSTAPWAGLARPHGTLPLATPVCPSTAPRPDQHRPGPPRAAIAAVPAARSGVLGRRRWSAGEGVIGLHVTDRSERVGAGSAAHGRSRRGTRSASRVSGSRG